MPRLTKRVIDSIRPSGREKFVWDDKLPGFGLRVWCVLAFAESDNWILTAS